MTFVKPFESHMFPGLNGHFLKHRFDALANDHNDPGRRLFVTEFDIDNNFDVDLKAEDLDDFMRLAFSHPSVRVSTRFSILTIRAVVRTGTSSGVSNLDKVSKQKRRQEVINIFYSEICYV